MRGSIKWQTHEVFKSSGINRIGESRHAAKEAARAGGARSSAAVAERTGIHSFRTAEAYRAVWGQCLQHAKDEFQVKDIERLTGEHVSSFLRARISEGVARQTFAQAAAALGKLENALNLYAGVKETGNTYDFRTEIRATGSEAKELRTMNPCRAFREPDRVISNLRDPDYRLAASIQRETGCRLSEAAHIRASQLRDGEKVTVRGKGGKLRTVELSRDTYRQLAERIGSTGEFRVERDAYRSAIYRASEAAGDRGSDHSFRHRWVQDTYKEKLAEGKSREQALAEVSRQIGHERADITLHYLGRR